MMETFPICSLLFERLNERKHYNTLRNHSKIFLYSLEELYSPKLGIGNLCLCYF